MRAEVGQGFQVLPVNPREESIESLPAYCSLEEIADPTEIISLYVPPAIGLNMLPSIAAKPPRELWLNPGSESDDWLEASADLHLRTVVACSIVAPGVSPGEFGESGGN